MILELLPNTRREITVRKAILMVGFMTLRTFDQVRWEEVVVNHILLLFIKPSATRQTYISCFDAVWV